MSQDTPAKTALHVEFTHVETWIFDLDNTLYPAECRLFDQIDKRMTGFIADALDLSAAEADGLRTTYWHRYGTTLAGLMQEHGIAPGDFLSHVHDIDLAHVEPDRPLQTAIDALPGRKVVYTNGSREHGERVTAQLGLRTSFEAIYGIEDSRYYPKPQREAFEHVLSHSGIEPTRSAMIEDTARNLLVPHDLGMRCIWVPTTDEKAREGAEGEHVHHIAEDLTEFLSRIISQP
ncbi:MAG: pyrimidine 5'-nucleotidase [Pseudomonadota bacterium]